MQSGRATGRSVLDDLQARTPELAGQIESLLFVFEDLGGPGRPRPRPRPFRSRPRRSRPRALQRRRGLVGARLRLRQRARRGGTPGGDRAWPARSPRPTPRRPSGPSWAACWRSVESGQMHHSRRLRPRLERWPPCSEGSRPPPSSSASLDGTVAATWPDADAAAVPSDPAPPADAAFEAGRQSGLRRGHRAHRRAGGRDRAAGGGARTRPNGPAPSAPTTLRQSAEQLQTLWADGVRGLEPTLAALAIDAAEAVLDAPALGRPARRRPARALGRHRPHRR